MKLEQQVVSLELAKKLKELGVGQETYFEWRKYDFGWIVAKTQTMADELDFVAAHTVAELGELLSKSKAEEFTKAYCEVMDFTPSQIGEMPLGQHILNMQTQPDISAKMLIYLLENKLI